MTSLLSLQSVSLGFARGRRHVVRVLSDASFDLEAGEVVAVLSQRAQGKTSLLRVAAGMQRPGAGHVLFEGEDLWAMPDRRRSKLLATRIGLVRCVEPDIDVTMQVHVATPAAVVYGWREAHVRAAAALERVGASGCSGQRWASLADWERALVVLAQGIVRRPRLLLVDDLTATLGLGETEALTRLVGELARELKMGVLMSVSDASATLWAGRIATLAGGELLEPERPSTDETDNVFEFPTEERSRRV